MRTGTVRFRMPMPADTQTPITIAGAGPSGLAAAMWLARAGRAVVVHEARPRVGDRWRGGWQIIENFIQSEDALALLTRLGIPVRFAHHSLTALTVFDDRMRATELRSASPLGYLVRRGDAPSALDGGLLAAALDAGVEVRWNSRVAPDQPVHIRATGPQAADGLGCELVFPTRLAHRLQVILDPRLAPGGYAYLFIHDGWATIGMALVRGFKQLDDYWRATLERFQRLASFDPGDAKRSIAYVNFCLPQRLGRNGTCTVGEAAGLQDDLLGFGIRSAIVSGCLAAQHVLGGDSYDAAWRRQLAPSQEMGLWLRFLYEGGGRPVARWLIQGAARRGDLRAYLEEWYRPAWWKRAALPWIRWRWGARGCTAHQPPEHWCRRRKKEPVLFFSRPPLHEK